MSTLPLSRPLAALSICIMGVLTGCALVKDTPPAVAQPPEAKPPSTSPTGGSAPDKSGGKQVGTQVGKASFYADKFAGRKMADGTPMDPNDNNAAHKTLPLGSTAKVTNLETGRSAVVTIQDRGPFVKGRIVDLSPATAREIGLTRDDGVAPVEVTPLSVPDSGGKKDGRPAARCRRARLASCRVGPCRPMSPLVGQISPGL